MTSHTENRDCMEAMREFPDGYFDLAVVDPPYGDALADESAGGGRWNRFGGLFDKYKTAPLPRREQEPERPVEQISATTYTAVAARERERERSSPDGRDMGGEVRKKIIAWDTAPGKEYFDELFRVSRNQIIWGGNYFPLPPTRCFLVWRKLTISESFSMAMAEYAWTSFNSNAKVYEHAPQDSTRFHPTQKPVDLYRWIYGLYAKPGDKILDTHLGSGSSRIAAWDAGLDFWGYEIDQEYFRREEERFQRHAAQMNLFLGGDE